MFWTKECWLCAIIGGEVGAARDGGFNQRSVEEGTCRVNGKDVTVSGGFVMFKG